MILSLNNLFNNDVKEAQTNNGEGLSLIRCPVTEQSGPSRHQTTAQKKWTKGDNKFVILMQKRKVKEDKETNAPMLDRIG